MIVSFFFLMIRRPPISTRLTHSFPTRRSSDLRLEAALSLDPENPEILNNLGMALLAVGRREEAETRLRAALERRPGWPDVLRNLGNLLRQSERLDGGVGCYRAARDGQPDRQTVVSGKRWSGRVELGGGGKSKKKRD